MAGSRGRWLRKLAIRNQAVREFLAETLGIFILVLLAVGGGLQRSLGKPGDSSVVTARLTEAIGVMLGISAAGGVSGGAVNPAVTLAFCLTNRMPWKMLPVHLIGQLVGAFAGMALLYAIFYDAINIFDGGERHVFGDNGTAAMFTHFPKDYLSSERGFLDSMVATGMLVLAVHFILDKYNMDAHKGMKPFLVALTVFAIGGSLGLNCGYPINPAADLAGRLFLLAAGWDGEVFSYRDYNWFWVPVVAPMAGSLVGTFLYYSFVGWHWTEEQRLRVSGSTTNSYTVNSDDCWDSHTLPDVSSKGDKNGVENMAYDSRDVMPGISKF